MTHDVKYFFIYLLAIYVPFSGEMFIPIFCLYFNSVI